MFTFKAVIVMELVNLHAFRDILSQIYVYYVTVITRCIPNLDLNYYSKINKIKKLFAV